MFGGWVGKCFGREGARSKMKIRRGICQKVGYRPALSVYRGGIVICQDNSVARLLRAFISVGQKFVFVSIFY